MQDQDNYLSWHLKRIRELNQHPLNQAALRWLEEGEKQKVPWTIERAMGVEAALRPSPYYLHVVCLLEWAMDETPLPPQMREDLEYHLELLEANPKEGLRYLLRFPEDGEPTMLVEQLRKAESLEEAGWTILDVFEAILTDDPLLGLPAEGKAVHVRIHRPDMGARRTETTREGERISIEGLHTTEVGSDVTVEEAVKLQQSANLIVDIFSSLIVGMESEEIWISTHS